MRHHYGGETNESCPSLEQNIRSSNRLSQLHGVSYCQVFQCYQIFVALAVIGLAKKYPVGLLALKNLEEYRFFFRIFLKKLKKKILGFF